MLDGYSQLLLKSLSECQKNSYCKVVLMALCNTCCSIGPQREKTLFCCMRTANAQNIGFLTSRPTCDYKYYVTLLFINRVWL